MKRILGRRASIWVPPVCKRDSKAEPQIHNSVNNEQCTAFSIVVAAFVRYCIILMGLIDSYIYRSITIWITFCDCDGMKKRNLSCDLCSCFCTTSYCCPHELSVLAYAKKEKIYVQQIAKPTNPMIAHEVVTNSDLRYTYAISRGLIVYSDSV